jgi:lipopolysaccharide export LptBFGC system permease protein LptF
LQQEIGMKSKSTLLLLVFVFCFSNSAFAYLDPGSGSYIIQMLIAGFLGSLYAIKLYWAKIVNFFKGNSSAEDDSLEEADDE